MLKAVICFHKKSSIFDVRLGFIYASVWETRGLFRTLLTHFSLVLHFIQRSVFGFALQIK